MNLIERQSIKYSIISYAGVLISTFSAIFLYPYDFAFMGDIRFLMSSATAVFPLIIMGASASMVKFYPNFKTPKSQLNLLYLAIFTLTVNALLLLGLYYLWQNLFGTPYFINDIWAHFPTIVILSFILGMIQVGCKYVSNFGRIVIPVIFESLVPKLASVIAFSIFVFLAVTKSISIGIFVGIILGGMILLMFYVSRFQQLKIQNPFDILKDKKFTKEFYAFSGFSLLGGIGSILATQIDVIMIEEMLNSYSTGTYATLLSIIGLMYIPFYAVNSISGPVISNYIYNEQWNDLKRFYQKISQNMFFIGSALFCITIAGAISLFHLMKNGTDLMAIFPVLYFLGAASLFDLATGFNNQIISYSKYYKFNLLVTLILAFLTIFLNYYFIKHFQWGVVGVSCATCISLTLFNLAKMFFIGFKFSIWPTYAHFLPLILLFTTSLLMAIYLPETPNYWFSLFYKPLCIILMYFLFNHYYKILPLKNFLNQDWKKTLMG